jgi:OFA family oxalate/formate antiporter-like MFS transporter
MGESSARGPMSQSGAQGTDAPYPTNRWMIAAAGIVMQVALGAVYAWSVFRIPLTRAYGWSISQVTFTFELAILMLGLAAFAGGLWMKHAGPRRMAVIGGLGYGLGVILAGQARGHLGLLYLSFGVLGGFGLGLCYIVPVATLIKWFPDKRGMITGLAVAGFGAGALVTAPVAQRLIPSVGLPATFAILGSSYLIAVLGSAFFMKNPPDGYRPAGRQPTLPQGTQDAAREMPLGEALRTWQWYALWAMLFLNTLAGISIISQAAPMAQEIAKTSAATAAGLVGIISIANAAGRFLWAWASDFIGRRRVFLIMFLTQVIMFLVLSRVHSFTALAASAFIVLFCYGGGFGTMPAYAADYFGSANVGSIYGLMLTAWGFAGVCGPTLIARVRQSTGHYTVALEMIGGIMLISAVLPFLIRPPRIRGTESNDAVQPIRVLNPTH